MSYQATGWAAQQRAGSSAAKAVLLVLAEHADKTGLAWPSTRTIANEAECDQRSVRRHLDALRDRGLVSWTPGAGRGSNRYQLSIVRRPGASQTGPSEARTASLRDAHDDRSEASADRSEALDHRSEATRPSDQQRSEQNHYVEPVTTEPAPSGPHAGAGASTRATQLPRDWTPHLGHRRTAEHRRVDLDHEAAQFQAHARANGRTLVDWDAGFDLWLGRAQPTAPNGVPRSVRGSTTDDRMAAAQALKHQMIALPGGA